MLSIDWILKAQFSLEVDGQALKVSGIISGKGFPAYESFIEDNKGTSVFLGVIPAPNRDQLEKELLNPYDDSFKSFNYLFELDGDGNFTGNVKINLFDNKGNITSYNTTTDDINSKAENTAPAHDCLSDECN